MVATTTVEHGRDRDANRRRRPTRGTTTEALWLGYERTPATIESRDVGNWLDAIAGRGVGTTEATADHHQRPDVVYRPVKDGASHPGAVDVVARCASGPTSPNSSTR